MDDSIGKEAKIVNINSNGIQIHISGNLSLYNYFYSQKSLKKLI